MNRNNRVLVGVRESVGIGSYGRWGASVSLVQSRAEAERESSAVKPVTDDKVAWWAGRPRGVAALDARSDATIPVTASSPCK